MSGSEPTETPQIVGANADVRHLGTNVRTEDTETKTVLKDTNPISSSTAASASTQPMDSNADTHAMNPATHPGGANTLTSPVNTVPGTGAQSMFVHTATTPIQRPMLTDRQSVSPHPDDTTTITQPAPTATTSGYDHNNPSPRSTGAANASDSFADGNANAQQGYVITTARLAYTRRAVAAEVVEDSEDGGDHVPNYQERCWACYDQCCVSCGKCCDACFFDPCSESSDMCQALGEPRPEAETSCEGDIIDGYGKAKALVVKAAVCCSVM